MSKLLKQAFTLIELLVVIAIIGILSGLIIVGMSGMTDKANIAKGQAFSSSLKNSLLMNLTSEWRFDGPTVANSPATTNDIKDTWGLNNGTFCSVGGSNPHPFPTVKIGSDCINASCLYFDNIDDNIVINQPTLRYTGGGMTISAWIKIDSSTVNYSMVLSKAWNGNGQYNYWIFWNSDNTLSFMVAGNGGAMTISANNVSKDKWLNVVAVVNSDTDSVSPKLMKLFINGISSATPAAHTVTTWVPSSGDSSVALDIGHMYPCDQSVPTWFFHGLMDEVRIYSAAMPTSQIKEQYYAGLNKLLVNGSLTNNEYLERIGEAAIALDN